MSLDLKKKSEHIVCATKGGLIPIFFPEQQRIEIKKSRQRDHLILGFSIGGGIDQDPAQNPFSQDKADKVSVHMFIG